ncbi:glycosyltransferase family 4 protein [Leptospira sp. 2 VSF19]|uniref:Glycosyltransferase family 4 protein n=1 Tax=Leptospira soteropolitanensis TaxID=2950025 RepID=A0AAW5VD89_9LEPT|nr:glycosyltransferase family 1 protein [Leptospira soteropolitanensis]MCW7491524.1 glycosyltransferase family 4 protein [Leptospira soteropolitanensis]MCW7499108.1 glycosyltransferase family 4 protein [Leptospira soteropolitanensis]MCW7521300.1 glycosyltransferase family 4 protein [Leptospira soteropolitanensis]MCW7525212.1 glycosyltransferase family 4 protein [Leptospira soteropolitanensis]MCW7529079.1 glycosyltransferase family 4 protein [Leptospira soteropolitanensis]
MRLKIGYDARMIENSGIGIRIQHILKFWPISRESADLFIFGDPKVLKKYNLPNHAEIIEYKSSIYSPKEFLGHRRMGEMDLLDIPHFNIPFPYICKCIVTIHDLIPYHFKAAHSSLIKRVYLQVVFRWIKWFARKIITVSEYTKQDLVRSFGYRNENISVVYNGIDLQNFSKQPLAKVTQFLKKHKLPKSYLFTVGIGKSHKNFPFLLTNLETLWEKKKLSLPLVVGGLKGEIPEEFLEIQKRYPDRIYFLSHLPYAELPLAYQGAKVFLYPSLMEGFGFPVLEAQSVGTPVFSSNASVLPEILGNAYESFDPKDSDSFQTKLLSLLKDSKRLNTLKSFGEKNAAKFQWKAAIQTLKHVYEPLLKPKIE